MIKSACQGSDHGNEFQHSADGAEDERVGHSHRTQKRRIHDERQCGQRQLRADEVCQHLVQIVEHVFQKLALRT